MFPHHIVGQGAQPAGTVRQSLGFDQAQDGVAVVPVADQGLVEGEPVLRESRQGLQNRGQAFFGGEACDG